MAARTDANRSRYELCALNDTSVSLLRYDPATGKSVHLSKFNLQTPLQNGKDYTLELRAVGQTLTAKLNDELLGTVTDATLTQPRFGILGVANQQDSAPALVKTIEVLDLTVSSVPSSPSLPVSASSDPKFPPGQWVKVFTKAEDLPNRGLKYEDGWIRFGKKKDSIALPKALSGNYGVRLRFIRDVPINNSSRGPVAITVRQQPNGFDGYNALLATTSFVFNRREQGKDTEVLSVLCPVIPKTGDEGTLEFFAVGSRLIGRVGDTFVTSTIDDQWARGSARISGSEDLRDIEVINLDGLSEAEALKILGVDEKGNDLRKPAAVAATAPAPSVPASNASRSDAGGSKSPPLPVSSSSDLKFPPGQWVKPFAKFEDIPPSARNQHKLTWKDGWIDGTAAPEGFMQSYIPNAKGRNQGVRARFKHDPKASGTYPGGLILRTVAGQRYSMNYNFADHSARISLAADKTSHFLSTLKPKQEQVDGAEYELEFYAIGQRLIGRMNGELLSIGTDASLAEGNIAFSVKHLMRDIEVINLDGLPEAEALRILGVDEKGNDLRALAAKQEQQMAEQAKAVDAMAAIPELKVLHEQFTKLTTERVTAPFAAEVAKLNAGYIGGIDRKIAEETAAGHLDDVIALEAEKKLLADKQPIPAEDAEGTTANLKALRAIYRAAYAKIEAARVANLKQLTDPLTLRLKQLEADLTKKDRVPDAKTVKEYRESSPGLQSAPAASASSATAPPQNELKLSTTLKDGFTNTLGMKFLPVKGTDVLFCIHEVRYSDYAAYAAEAQGVDGTWKDQSAGGYALTERKEEHPVTQVSWEEAQKFCAWLSQKEGKLYRLPTDEEWSIAVGLGRAEKRPQGTTPAMLSGKESTEFPWGGDFPPKTKDQAGNYSDASRKAKAPNGAAQYLEDYDDGFPTTAPVMSFKPNKLGIYDLGGNVWEWCEDWYDNAQKDRVLRGGSWHLFYDRGNLLSSSRLHLTPGFRNNGNGFRIVVEMTAP